MTMRQRLYLLRHGSTGAGNRYIGSTDLPLSPEGVADLEGAADLLQRQELDAVFCSPMRRCRQTLDRLGLHLRPEIVDDLREIDFGRWEGLSFAEICATDGDLVDRWAQGEKDFAFPEGESLRGFLLRIDRIRLMLTTMPARRPLLVTHGGIIRHLVCACLGIEPEKSLLFAVKPGRCTVIDLHSAGGVLAGMNLGER
ncbi:histidine phosphatase family protein [Desulfoprunum benzoelyticum]|uniref:Broad specificity phosphatase PhoE n=1 Tax=Desulfoprunum benzoelyticum TaxID=1506996 RepID=A0A840UNQ3_9BACT|nr:histidine phosphatase family protein [Desulfoprunum benzoelyticum]MBB5346456.1 broad specificity phosphatase PhoE [Desulfoprunum benzoelyticum]MBM9528546.1 histidine phosphatase family protein [Desulfoprunum benzoelyticum]